MFGKDLTILMLLVAYSGTDGSARCIVEIPPSIEIEVVRAVESQQTFVINDNGNYVEIVPYIDIEEIIGKEDFGNGKKPENVTAKGTPYSIVYAPCPTGTRKDENGNCRQSL